MILEFTTDRPAQCASDCIIVGVYQDRMLTRAAAEVDERLDGQIKRLMESGDVNGKAGTTHLLLGSAGLNAARVLLVGLGEQGKYSASAFQKATLASIKALRDSPVRSVTSYLAEAELGDRGLDWRAQQTLVWADWQAYRYTATLGKSAPKDPGIERFICAASVDGSVLQRARAIASGVGLARELGNLPPNICNPGFLAERGEAMAKQFPSVSVEVLGEAQMAELGMGALLAVGQGSENESRLIVLRHQGGPADQRPHVLVGKGITFDTGGISLKPGPGMDEMKFDMCGAAGMLGTFHSVAAMNLPLNVVCIIAAVENMPDGKAYRPGDVLTSMSGQTIEVLNTDAEGRLILCDALTYAQRFQPVSLIDAATLTGACVIALGKHASGLLSKSDELAAQLLAAGEASLDRAWRLPLWDDYQPQLDSIFADMANIGGKSAGTITASCFLARFTEGQNWAHLDIAGSAWEEGRKGMATGRPVSLLVQYLIDRAAA